jgi:hypothetical protein
MQAVVYAKRLAKQPGQLRKQHVSLTVYSGQWAHTLQHPDSVCRIAWSKCSLKVGMLFTLCCSPSIFDSNGNHSRRTIRWFRHCDVSTGSSALLLMSLASLKTLWCLAAGEQDLQDQAGLVDWDTVLEVVTTLVENNTIYQRQASNACWVKQCLQLDHTGQKLCLQLFLQASQA